MRVYWTNGFEKGNVAMMARPRGNDWLEDEILKLQQLEIKTVVSLLEIDEILELGIEKEKGLCDKYGIDFINFPIRDRGVPEDIRTFKTLVSTLNSKLEQGQKIAIHCRMGIGRTSLLTASLLVKNGTSASTVFDLLSVQRTLEVPDTPGQKEWTVKFESELKS